MKVVFIEATAEELTIRPNLMDSVMRAVNLISQTICPVVPEKDEDEGDDHETDEIPTKDREPLDYIKSGKGLQPLRRK